jgi:hypothetical protein
MPSWGIFEYYRQRAEELEKRRKPPPLKTVHPRDSMEWQAEQEKQKNAGRLFSRPRRVRPKP